eukprot:365079-Chlamydomonas_euryale.AAC.5
MTRAALAATAGAKMKIKDKNKPDKKVAELQASGFEAELDWELEAVRTPSDSFWNTIRDEMERIAAPAAWDITTGDG